jgi:hypothetical protein
MRRALLALLLLSCADGRGRPAPIPAQATRETHDATSFLAGRLRPWPRNDSDGLLAVTDPAASRVASYDSALLVLVLLRTGHRETAARVLRALSALQEADGGLPFSFTLPAPDPAHRYERAGAIAWVGYAAAEYLDAEQGGPARDVARTLGQRVAGYLLSHQVNRAGDPRDGLVRGGTGSFRYELRGEEVREEFDPADISWASVEHNIDAYFALRALARVIDERAYVEAARRIGDALRTSAWSDKHGQFVSGLDPGGRDETLALDCASWGSVLLGAIGEAARADTAFAIADARFASTGPGQARGHQPYAHGPVLSDERLMRHFARMLPATSWEALNAVWPEGTAGVAFAALRQGRSDRARTMLDALEPLRSADGSLPTSTVAVPFLLDTRPGIAGTAWVELVRFELDRPPGKPTLWTP